MDTTQLDHLAKALAASRTRRALSRALAALPITGAGGLLVAEAGARRKAQTEKKKKKKAFCFRGNTVRAKKKKKVKKLRKKGATKGACRTCNPACRQGQRCCGTTCLAGPWGNDTLVGSQGTGPSSFHYPAELALSPDGLTAFIADSANDRISVWSRPSAGSTAWANLATFGSTGPAADRIKNPRGVAVTPNGLMALVADTDHHQMTVWTRPSAGSTDWTRQTAFGSYGTGDNQFDYPIGGAISPDGLTAWAVDYRHSRISVWNRTSPTVVFTHQKNFGSEGTGPSNFKIPTGMAVTSDGLTACVVDNNNNRVSVWVRPDAISTDWTNRTTFGSFGTGPGEFFGPHRVAVAPDGLTAWITDGSNRRVSVWTRPSAGSTAWTNQALFGSFGTGPSNFSNPDGIAVTPDGLTTLVADLGLHRVSVWDLACPG